MSGGDATLEDGLSALESADLIRKGHVDPDLEYLFKHALTQEVAYQGLLRSKRHELHGRVGEAMERLLGERQREYAESIAYHFENSDTPERAVQYLVIAGKKAVERYALAEAETHYRSAYDILLAQPASSQRDHDLLELIVEWELLHYYTADILSSSRLMKEHAYLLERVPDPELRGMWLVWHCFVGYCTLKLSEAVHFADRAIEIGEECGSPRVVACALTQQTWALMQIGRHREGMATAQRALGLIEQLSDERDRRYIRFKAGCGYSLMHLGAGDLIKSRALAKELFDFANTSGSRRALSLAHFATGYIHAWTGDRERAGSEFALSRDAAPDPVYRVTAEVGLTIYLIGTGQFEAAREIVEASLRLADVQGIALFSLLQRGNASLLLLAEGELTKGMDQLEAVQLEAGAVGSPNLEMQLAYAVASVYANIAMGEAQSSGSKLGVIVRNPGFALGRARRASRTARDAFAEFSSNLPQDLEGWRFNVEFEFAKLLIKRRERDEARKHLEKAIAFLQPLGDSVGMRDARALLATLDAK